MSTERLADLARPFLEPDDEVTHAFVANTGPRFPMGASWVVVFLCAAFLGPFPLAMAIALVLVAAIVGWCVRAGARPHLVAVTDDRIVVLRCKPLRIAPVDVVRELPRATRLRADGPAAEGGGLRRVLVAFQFGGITEATTAVGAPAWVARRAAATEMDAADAEAGLA